MGDLRKALDEIERDLDQGCYRPGPWARFLAVAVGQSKATRLALAEDVTRVSDKLHQGKHTSGGAAASELREAVRS